MKISNSKPDPRLRIDPAALGLREYSRSFFRGDTAQIAQDLVGGWFARYHEGEFYGARIVETEAYLGIEDPAAHSFRGRRTARVEPMYKDGGHLYVYFVYGMHHCANIVTRREGIPQAVLLRAAEGPAGVPPKLLAGPARLCAALGITVASSGIDLLYSKELKLFRRTGRKPNLGRSTRIGINYAGTARDWPLRFFDLSSPAVSGPACRSDSASEFSALPRGPSPKNGR
jgi:DNA-3-methyladenine glycosylase